MRPRHQAPVAPSGLSVRCQALAVIRSVGDKAPGRTHRVLKTIFVNRVGRCAIFLRRHSRAIPQVVVLSL